MSEHKIIEIEEVFGISYENNRFHLHLTHGEPPFASGVTREDMWKQGACRLQAMLGDYQDDSEQLKRVKAVLEISPVVKRMKSKMEFNSHQMVLAFIALKEVIEALEAHDE